MKTLLLSVTLLTAALAPLPTCLAEETAPAAKLDFGDYSSSAITGKAWKALEAKNYAEVMGYTGKCIEMFKTQAVSQQKGLTEAPSEKEEVFKQWALNDVGTCYYIQARALDAQDKKKEALAAYKFLAENLQFAQCWDANGWFWKPAEAAQERIKAIEFDSLK